MELINGKRYYCIPAHRYVYFTGIRSHYWAGEIIREYTFTDVVGAYLAYDASTFNIERDLEER